MIAAAVMMIIAAVPVLAGGIPGAVSRSASSVVRLTVNNSFGTEKVTGVAIGKGRRAKYILTGLRAVEGKTDSILVGCSDDENISASVIATDSKTGLAVLELSEELDTAKPAKLKMKELKEGDAVYTIGYYAKEDSANITDGTVMALSSYSANGLSSGIYQITADVTARNNGGMMSDKRGSLAGICYYDGNTDSNKAITSVEISAMLDNHEIDYKKATIIYLIIVIVLIAAAVAAAAYAILMWLKQKKENQPRLIGVSGEMMNQSIPVTAENISIGRDAKICQIVVLNDSKVSRCHCSIRFDSFKHTFVITDLSSTHGTYVNGEKLEPNVPRYISPGTVFSLGSENTSFRTAEGGDAL